jgi:hypothetical protein
MHPNFQLGIIGVLVFVLLLTLTGCGPLLSTPYATNAAISNPPDRASDQATRAAALTQGKNNADNQAAATAEIMRANALATLNSANATLNAVQTQDQNSANVIAGQIAATAAIIRANAQATLNSAGSTQSAALTQDAIRQTQVADMATSGAEALLIQQNKNAIAASTQTAEANQIATQTRAAAATSQWYADQARQRDEQRQVPIGFLWAWCFPIFIVLFAGLALWGFWRWLRIRQANQSFAEDPVDEFQAPVAEVIDQRQDDELPYLDNEIVENRYQLTKPDDQVRKWLDEVKRKLLISAQKDDDDDADI